MAIAASITRLGIAFINQILISLQLVEMVQSSGVVPHGYMAPSGLRRRLRSGLQENIDALLAN
jgi:hypothetical protein